MIFPAAEVEKLKADVCGYMSKKRYLHTLAVADAAIRLSKMCLPDEKSELEVAALLHDITKELSQADQYALLSEACVTLDDEDIESVGVLHSFTAPIFIKKCFAKFATENVLSSVRYHTLGAPQMSVFDEIVFLADFIEDTRTYDSSVKLREFVWSNMLSCDVESNLKVLHYACVKAIDCTIINLIENKKKINSKNILTRNALLSKI